MDIIATILSIMMLNVPYVSGTYEEELRNRYVESIYDIPPMVYELGGDGTNGRIDCTGVVAYPFLSLKTYRKFWTWNYYHAGYMVPRYEIEKGDLLLMIGKNGNPNHTAVILEANENYATIIDMYPIYREVQAREIWYGVPGRDVYLIKNPRIIALSRYPRAMFIDRGTRWTISI